LCLWCGVDRIGQPLGLASAGRIATVATRSERQERLDIQNEGERVPRIIVMADRPTDTVMLSERIGAADLDSEHFRAQLLERLSWAVGDAHVAEQTDRGE
jgi:hypothetical protein